MRVLVHAPRILFHGSWRCVAAVLFACTPSDPASAPAVARDFSVRQTDGRTFTLAEHQGEVVVLAFFATWSKPSVVELRHLKRLADRHRSEGLTVVGVAVDGPETVAEVPAFATRNELTFPIVLDEDSHVVSLFNPKRDVPLTVLVDRHGATARIWSGYNPGDEDSIAAETEAVLSR
jgi:peroxiredoxin